MFHQATHVLQQAARALFAALLACALTNFCTPAAYAEYNIAAPSKDYTAVDKVTVTGKAIKASQIPAGSYHITASTSSSMASMSNVVLTVSGGSMTVNFTLTPSYTAVYPGKPEEAASLSNDDGTEASPSYIMGKLNSDGQTRNYTMAISALNSVLVYSAYNGNSKRNSGMWYGRNVCFNSSAEIDALVATSGGGDDDSDADDPGKDDPGADKPGADDPGSGGGAGGGTGADDKPTGGNDKPGSGSGGAAGSGGTSHAGGKDDASGGSAAAADEPADDGDAADDEPDADDVSSSEDDPEPANTFAALDAPLTAIAYADNGAAEEGPTKEAQALDVKELNYHQLLVALTLVLLAVGFIARTLVYQRQRK